MRAKRAQLVRPLGDAYIEVQEVDMPKFSIRPVWAALVIAAPLLLSACGPFDPMYGPDAPKNGFGQPVHPIYGTQLPGTTPCCGGRP